MHVYKYIRLNRNSLILLYKMSLTKSVSLVQQIHSTKLFYMCVCIIWYMLYDTYYFYYMFIFCISMKLLNIYPVEIFESKFNEFKSVCVIFVLPFRYKWLFIWFLSFAFIFDIFSSETWVLLVISEIRINSIYKFIVLYCIFVVFIILFILIVFTYYFYVLFLLLYYFL